MTYKYYLKLNFLFKARNVSLSKLTLQAHYIHYKDILFNEILELTTTPSGLVISTFNPSDSLTPCKWESTENPRNLRNYQYYSLFSEKYLLTMY